MMNRQTAGPRPLLAIALLGGMALTAFAHSARTNGAAPAYHGNCGAANGGGPNSTNYYSKGDPARMPTASRRNAWSSFSATTTFAACPAAPR